MVCNIFCKELKKWKHSIVITKNRFHNWMIYAEFKIFNLKNFLHLNYKPIKIFNSLIIGPSVQQKPVQYRHICIYITVIYIIT